MGGPKSETQDRRPNQTKIQEILKGLQVRANKKGRKKIVFHDVIPNFSDKQEGIPIFPQVRVIVLTWIYKIYKHNITLIVVHHA